MSVADYLDSLFNNIAAPATPITPDSPAPVVADTTAASPAAPAPASGVLWMLPQAIKLVAPKLSDADVQAWATALLAPMTKAEITTVNRAAIFLANLAEETGGFQVFEENLHYTTAARLCAVWPSRFANAAAAAPYVNNPQKLANYVYAGRYGNGNAASGDGYRFRGQGPIQITFRSIFAQFGATVGKTAEDAAAYILTPEGGAASACWYWTNRNLNPLADAYDVAGITQKINGGLTNEALREQLSAEEKALFGQSQ
jgi:putative chitinase